MIRSTVLAVFTAAALAQVASAAPAKRSDAYDEMIAKTAKQHGVPEHLAHHIVARESGYNPRLVHRRFYGLMQISYATARSMGYKGEPNALLDPKVNLTYAMPYLANAYLVSDGDEKRAVSLYSGGYYWAAKRKKLLDLLRTADSKPLVEDKQATALATAEPEKTEPKNPVAAVFGFLASHGDQPNEPQAAAPQEPAAEAVAAKP